MKKYRLLKDSSIFKAGDIFKLEGGNLYYYPAENGTENAHWFDRIMAYHHKTLEKFPNILDEWFEEVEEPKEYWCINEWGIIEDTDYKNDKYDNAAKEIGNYFSSKEEAELAVRKLKAWKRLKDKGFKFVEHQIHGMTEDGEGDGCAYFEFDKPLDKSDLDLLFCTEED